MPSKCSTYPCVVLTFEVVSGACADFADIMGMLTWLKKQRMNDEGFTLVEIMVVVLIIGILTAIAIPMFLEQQKTAHRAQVDDDVLKTASSLSQWQSFSDNYNPIPSNSVFQSEIVVKSNTQTTLTLKSLETGDAETRQFCVEGASNIGGEAYRSHYSLTTKKKGTGVCPAFVTQMEENYG